jgi:hypothetical protein
MKLISSSTAQLGFHWVLIPVIVVTMTLWPTISSGLQQLQADPGDTLLNLYILEHAHQHFSGLHVLNSDHYWSPDFFWPIKDTLAWSDHLLGPCVIYGLFRSLLDPFQSYLGWLSVTLWFNYISIRHAIERISPQTLPIWASIAALATSFSPAITQQLNHPQLLSLFLIGPILWHCHRLISQTPIDFSISDWLLLATWLLANGFFNIYIFVYACYGVLICTAIHLIRRVSSTSFGVKPGKQLPLRTIVLIAFAALNLSIYIPYLQTLKTFGKRPLEEVINNLPKPGSWLFGSNHWLLPPPWTPSNVNPNWVHGAEQELFPGWSLCILLVATIFTAMGRPRKQDNSLGTIRIWLVALAAMVLLSLSIHNISAWIIISKLLPGASALRASSRVGMMIVLFASPAIALAAKQWRLAKHQTWTPIAGLFALSGSFAGIWAIGQPAFSLAKWKQETLAISGALQRSSCAVFWYEWSGQAAFEAQVKAMHAQLRTNIPTANGYSGQFPRENWPFEISSGNFAYSWITKSNPGQYHQLKPLSNPKQWCIVNIDEAGNASIRKYDPRKEGNETINTIQKPTSIVFENGKVSISEKLRQLYLKRSSSKGQSEWILITRDNRGIPADRGNFKISSAGPSQFGKKTIVFIVDRNPAQGIEYEWIVDARNGVFLGQRMRTLPQK